MDYKTEKEARKAQERSINRGWQKTPAELAAEGISEGVREYLKHKGKKDPLGGKRI